MASDHAGTPAHSGPSATAFPTSPTSMSSSHILNPSDSESPKFLNTSYKADPSNNLPSLTSIASAGLKASSIPRSPKALAAMSPRSPPPLTAAAARADERRAREGRERAEGKKQSQNPANSALGALLGQNSGMSKPHDAPTATTSTSDGVAAAASAISMPENMQVDSNPQTSPTSISSVGSFTSAAANATVTSVSEHSSRTTAPQVDVEKEPELPHEINNALSEDASTSEDKPSSRAFTFPGPSAANVAIDDGSSSLRGMSLPMPGSSQNSARSPTSRKHKCPYCSTDFTRHHNLKSHLLTHSHEKPFVCSTCQARFRRLHDLKRHTKLHTGERPHICPKCGRRFARGDALARHNKGHGGCAGRRASMGSLGGDDDYDDGSSDRHDNSSGRDDGMDGLVYTGDSIQDGDRLDGSEAAEERRRRSLPSIKAPDGTDDLKEPHSGGQNSFQSQRQPSTYPPAARPGAAPPARAFPSPSGRGEGSSAAASPNLQAPAYSPKGFGSNTSSGPAHAGGPSLFSQTGITESPKPLSPAAAATHQLGHAENPHMRPNRSSSLTEQFQHQHFGRRGGGRTPPALGLPPLSGTSHAPHLLSLPGLAPPEARYSHSGQPSGGHGSVQSKQQPGGGMSSSTLPQPSGPQSATASTNDSTSTHGHSSGEGLSKSFPSSTDALWDYVRGLEERLNALTEEVHILRNECMREHRCTGPGSA